MKNNRGFGGDGTDKPMSAIAAFFALMVGVLVFANWAAADSETWMQIYAWKWHITALLSAALAGLLVWRWHWPASQLLILAAVIAAAAVTVPSAPELPFAIGIAGLIDHLGIARAGSRVVDTGWDFAKQILPLLLGGVFIAGFALGRPGHEGIIPSEWVAVAVGDNTLASTIIASVLGALMYFSTLTEVPIVDALMGAGMGKGRHWRCCWRGPHCPCRTCW